MYMLLKKTTKHCYLLIDTYYTQGKNAGDAIQYNEVILPETIRVAVVGMVRNDSGLQMPLPLEFFIQQEFLKNLDYYERVASRKRVTIS